MSRRSAGIAVTAGLVAAVIGAAAWADHSWGSYHWARTSNPFTLKLGDNVKGAWQSNLEVASADWSVSSVLDTVIVSGGTSPRACRPTNGRVEVCNAKYGNTGWLGIAQIWITSGSHIYQGTAKNNDTYFNSPPYNTNSWRQLVMCQEVAHTFGLDHQDENFNNPNLGTCMDYTSNPVGNEHPNAHDYEQLEAIYAHLDDFNTPTRRGLAGQPPAMNELELDGPGQWGRLVYLSRSGAQAVYELDFGNGNKIVTFVIWTRDVARDLARQRDRLLRR